MVHIKEQSVVTNDNMDFGLHSKMIQQNYSWNKSEDRKCDKGLLAKNASQSKSKNIHKCLLRCLGGERKNVKKLRMYKACCTWTVTI